MAHHFAKNPFSMTSLDFDDINLTKNFISAEAYSKSKLCNVYHCKELARRLNESGIAVYSLHPGMNVLLYNCLTMVMKILIFLL